MYNLNMPILVGNKLENKNRFYFGAVTSYAFRISYSEIINSFSPSKFDVKLHLSYSKEITRYVGVDFTGQVGGINIAMFGNGYMQHWALAAKCYVRIMTKRSEAFIPAQ